MNRWVYAASVLGSVVVGTGMVAVSVTGCSGDDSNGGGGSDASDDGSTYDAGGNDGSNGDGATDANTDGPADAGPDTSAFDAGPPALLQYSHQINVLYCQKLQSCCNGSNPGGFDLATCISNFDNKPGQFGITDNALFAPYVDGGNVTFDPAKAQQCFQEIASLACGGITSAAAIAVRDDCNAAVIGKLAVGAAGCHGSVECTAPNHCDPGGPDGGACAPPRAAAAGCGSTNPTNQELESVAQCGSRVTSIPGYCAIDNGGTTFRADSVCHPPEALGTGCYESYECASGICGDTTDPVLLDAGAGACGNSIVFATQDTCEFYRLADGGK